MSAPPFSIRALLVLSLLLISFNTSAWSAIHRVRTGGFPAGNGTSWFFAFSNLQDALDAASAGDEIWVAGGTYTPDQGANQTLGDVNAFLTLKEGVAIYGGFPPQGAGTSLASRDVVANPTILSGDLGAATSATQFIRVNANTTSATVLDGFTVSDGGAGALLNVRSSPIFRNCIFRNNTHSSQGAAARITDDSNPSFIDCVFTGNSASGTGGAVSLGDSGAVFENCRFEANSSDTDGGAVYINSFGGAPVTSFTNCDFINNPSDRQGGALAAFGGNQSFELCDFEGNTASFKGGAVFGRLNSQNYTDCTFTTNSTLNSGTGGALLSEGGSCDFLRVSFTSNTAQFSGGAVRGITSGGVAPGLSFIDCSFDANVGNPAAIDVFGPTAALGELVVRASTFTNHTTSSGKVVGISQANVEVSGSSFLQNASDALEVFHSDALDSTVQVTATRFEGNVDALVNDSFELVVEECQFIDNTGNGIRVSSDTQSATLRDCDFSGQAARTLDLAGNQSSMEGCNLVGNPGGALSFRGVQLTVINCILRGNSSTFGSAGARLNGDIASFTNCLFAGNQSSARGSALSVNVDQAEFINCSFTGNASADDGTILISNGDVSFSNTLVHLNTSGFPSVSADRQSSSIQVEFDYSDLLTFQRCMVDNFTKADLDALSTTQDNFENFDPLFRGGIDPASAPSTAGDFRLESGSPAINAGVNAANLTTTDLGGGSRINEGLIDLGAYEFAVDPFVQDNDGDGIPNGIETALGTDPETADLADLRQFEQVLGSQATFTFGHDVSTAPTIILELRRSIDMVNFDDVIASSESGFPVANGSGQITVSDPNPPAVKAFYRLEARQK